MCAEYFLDGLAELGIDKGLIKNKKLLSDLIENEKGHRTVENTPDNDSNNEESSSDIENQEEEEEVASDNGVEAEGTQGSDNDTENNSQKTESSYAALKRPPPFNLKVSVNIAKTLISTRHSSLSCKGKEDPPGSPLIYFILNNIWSGVPSSARLV